MPWKVYFYQTPRGEKLVKEFIKKLQESTIGKISKNIDLLKIHGALLGMPYSKRMNSDIFELRIKGKEEIRIFYSFKNEEAIYLLHAYKKQSNKTPKNEIKIALVRNKLIQNIP